MRTAQELKAEEELSKREAEFYAKRSAEELKRQQQKSGFLAKVKEEVMVSPSKKQPRSKSAGNLGGTAKRPIVIEEEKEKHEPVNIYLDTHPEMTLEQLELKK